MVICRGGSTQSGEALPDSRLDLRPKEEHLPFYADLRPPSFKFGAGVPSVIPASLTGARREARSSSPPGAGYNKIKISPFGGGRAEVRRGAPMEGRKRNGGTTCIPRRRRSHPRPSPASLLDRFREVVFRLIMMTAAASRGGGAQARARQGRRAHGGGGGRVHRSDSYRSEAVEDCIEFFKRSASGIDTKGEGVGEDAVTVVAFRPYQPCEA
ncbi:hypothetical protein Taro_008799 [Colocasia esculenta]|uniref:Uncharacterized protein n=1 Tax=Colocasia esculenta TaxID=4460 RepID=A0A843U816_COLES|nr:hypothetical protein [Colocasia esculenta]